jgi:hypothetical protein
MSSNKQGLALGVLAAVWLVSATGASAQTDLSLRTRAIGASFGGVVEDLISDAFLNPARLSAFTGTQVYLAANPHRRYTLPYPRPSDSYGGNALLPTEGYARFNYRDYSESAPYEATLFTGLGEGTRASFSFAFFSDGSDDFEEGDEVRTGSDNLRLEDTARGGSLDLTSFRLEGALSTGDNAEDKSTGLRLALSRSTSEVGSVESHQTIYFEPVSETALATRYNKRTTDFVQLEAVLSGGIFRPGSMLREFMLTAGYSSREFDTENTQTSAYDNDLDGNGVGMGGSPEQDYTRSDFTAARAYDGPVIRSRLHMDLTDHVVFTAGGFYEYRTGSGPASHSFDDIDNEIFGGSSMTVRTPYEYDGTDSRYGLNATFGYREELIPSVLFALGASFQFRRDDFSETGVGTMSVEIVDTTPVSVQVEYEQKAWRIDDAMYLSIPAGVEWAPIKQLAVRLGMELVGRRTEETRVFRRSPDTTSLPSEFTYANEFRWGRTTDQASAYFTSGLGANLAERLFLDLLYQSGSTVSLTGFSYVSLRLIF